MVAEVCRKQAEGSSAQSGRPHDTGGKHGAREAWLWEGGAAAANLKARLD